MCLIHFQDKSNHVRNLPELLSHGCWLDVDKNHRSPPCPFKLQPPVKHCSAAGIMNHLKQSWSGLLGAISGCHGFVPPRLNVEFFFFFISVNAPACGPIPDTCSFSISHSFFKHFFPVYQSALERQGKGEVKKIPFIPGVKMHSV